MELSEFDIKYEPRGPIKGQIFADFVVELSSEATRVEGDGFRWVLSVDGSSNQQGSGAEGGRRDHREGVRRHPNSPVPVEIALPS